MHVLGTIASSKLTTVANSFESIATLSLSGLSTATFSSIPGTYKHLQLRGVTRGTSTGGITFRYNGDTASNYRSGYITAAGTGTTVTTATSAAATALTIASNATSSSPALSYSPFYANIYNYASTSQFKHSISSSFLNYNSSTIYSSAYDSYWSSTSAITSITILISTGTFDANSTIALYGIKG